MCLCNRYYCNPRLIDGEVEIERTDTALDSHATHIQTQNARIKGYAGSSVTYKCVHCWHSTHCNLRHLLPDSHCSSLKESLQLLLCIIETSKQNANGLRAVKICDLNRSCCPGWSLLWNTTEQFFFFSLKYSEANIYICLFFFFPPTWPFFHCKFRPRFQFKLVEINSIQSIFFHSHKFRCSRNTWEKKYTFHP